MLATAELIELIDIDECTGGESEGQSGLTLQVQVLGIIGAELRRQQDTAETGLTGTLVAGEQRHEGITVFAVDALPTSHHRQHPRMEIVGPMGGIGRDTEGQGGDTVLSVPR